MVTATPTSSASSGDDKIAWYENLGGGSFGSRKVIVAPLDGPDSVYAADLDGDGDADASASYLDDKIAWTRTSAAAPSACSR